MCGIILYGGHVYYIVESHMYYMCGITYIVGMTYVLHSDKS